MNYHKKYLEVRPLKELIEESVTGGWITECFYFMKHFLKNKDQNSFTETILDEIVILESRFNNLNSRYNRGTIKVDNFTQERNKIIKGILDIRKLISKFFPESKETLQNRNVEEIDQDKHVVTLTTNYDFDTITEDEKNDLIQKILKIFSSSPDHFIFKNIKRGSVKIEINSGLRHFINLKLLQHIGFLDKFRVEGIGLENKILEKIIVRHIMKAFYEEDFNKAYVIENLTFDNCDFSEKTVKYIKFYNCSFQNVNFSKSKFSFVLFEKSTFTDSNFLSSEFRHSTFVKTNLSKADFNKVSIQNSAFYYSNLRKCTLEEARIIHTSFYCSILGKVNFVKAKLESIEFSPLFQNAFEAIHGKEQYIKDSKLYEDYMKLDTVDFNGASLNKVSFISLEQVLPNLKNAQIKQLRFRNMIITDDFSNMNIDGFHFKACQIMNSRFVNSSFKMAEIHTCKVIDSTFNKADLSGSNLDKSKFNKSSFDNANLESSSLLKIEIDDFSKLRKANLDSAKFSKSAKNELIKNGVDITNVIFVDDDNKGGGYMGPPSGTGPKTPTPTPVTPKVPDPVL